MAFQIQLKEITKLLGLKEEILIETPTKVDAPATVFAYELPNEKIRKVAAAPGSPIQVVSSQKLSLKLKSISVCTLSLLDFRNFQ